jgi:hypothetical protein
VAARWMRLQPSRRAGGKLFHLLKHRLLADR